MSPVQIHLKKTFVKAVAFVDCKLSPCFDCIFFSFGYVPGVTVLYADISELSIGSIF